MPTAIAAYCLLAASGLKFPASRYQQSQTAADQITRALPSRTGKNGYEEYADAAKLISVPAFGPYESLYTDATGGVASGVGLTDEDPVIAELRNRLKGMTYLDVKREEVSRFNDCLQLVRMGSLKPVFDPRPELTPETLLPEFAHFKKISRLFAAEGYVRFADGASAEGTQSFMDGLAFNYHISGGSIIAALVGVAGSAILFRAFEPRLDSLSVHDCRTIQRTCEQILSAPMGIRAGFEVERKSNAAALAKALKSVTNFKDLMKLMGDGASDADLKALQATIAGAQPGDLARWTEESVDSVNALYRSMESRLPRPEGEWFGTGDDLALVQSQYGLVARKLLDIVTPATDQLMAAAARQRTQFRLLRLHGIILEYKWQHNRLPDQLSNVASDADRHDPLSGREFGYTRKGSGYRLFSHGNAQTGEIELYYQRPPDAGASSGQP